MRRQQWRSLVSILFAFTVLLLRIASSEADSGLRGSAVGGSDIGTNVTRLDGSWWVNTTYEQRVVEHDVWVLTPGNVPMDARGAMFLQIVKTHHQAFPLDEVPLTKLLQRVGDADDTSDFAIVPLIRILCLIDDMDTSTNVTRDYQSRIRSALLSEHYWYTTRGQNDDTMNSENHMILWMSSSWLLNERRVDVNVPLTNPSNDEPSLRQRLVHYLNLKVSYGFYEFLSITYLPFTLGALLNLVDFAVDTEVQRLAEQAVRRWIADYLLFVNDKGVHFTVAGRDYAECFTEEPYTQPMDGLLYILTGLGQFRPQHSFGYSAFLTTSTLNLTQVASSWNNSIDTTYQYGHTLSESFKINSKLEKYDRVVFQFSQGGYAHPLVLQDTLDFIEHYGPIKFKNELVLDGSFIPTFTPDTADIQAPPILKELFARVTVGSVSSGNSIRLYRRGGSMLTSVKNFWPGMVGAQTFPWMAVADDLPVWTQSGLITPVWTDRDGTLTNTHLPMIVQDGNVALIVYQPVQQLPLAEYADVALNWPVNRFDETRTVSGKTDKSSNSIFIGSLFLTALKAFFARQNKETDSSTSKSDERGSWILGRRRDAFVAVYRPCGDATKEGWYACNGVVGRQLWAVVVGDTSRYGSFDAFAAVVAASNVEESTRGRRLFRKPKYTTALMVDGIKLRHEW